MNIIITVESYFPLKNGVQEITQRYAEHLALNNKVRVITKMIDGVSPTDHHNGVEIVRLNILTKKSIYCGDISGYRKLLLELTEWADVMINVCAQTAFTDCIIKELDKYQCKKVLYLHGIAHFAFPKIERVDFHDVLSWLLNVIRWRLFYHLNMKNLAKYDAIIHLHRKDASYLMCKKLPLKNYVLENTTHINQINQKKKYDRNIDESSKPWIMIANYLHDKNQELAIKSYFISMSTRKLLFVGSCKTKYLAKLIRLAHKYEKKYSNKEIEFIVGEEHDETMKRLQQSFALIHTSKSEKYPVVLCESMALGIPFIAMDTGTIKYLDGGIICTNCKDLTSAINSIEESKTLYNSLSKKAIDYSQKYQNEERNLILLDDIINSVFE